MERSLGWEVRIYLRGKEEKRDGKGKNRVWTLERIPWGVSAKYSNSWSDIERSVQEQEEGVAKNPGFCYLSVLTTLILLLVSLWGLSRSVTMVCLLSLSLALQFLTVSASFCGAVCVSLGKRVNSSGPLWICLILGWRTKAGCRTRYTPPWKRHGQEKYWKLQMMKSMASDVTQPNVHILLILEG